MTIVMQVCELIRLERVSSSRAHACSRHAWEGKSINEKARNAIMLWIMMTLTSLREYIKLKLLVTK